eukprot:CAMPEP_0113470258 /NCGR_PEP_ID=MMETSP0014_2-20120614/16344_1 /TAXON_ID=2857 /ORGANISM="Nitzschia sp." /LENGTH=139 /DNA_ID=CAMNT_0000362805 /DNA_START=102 /DNA_END=522 /DNA_ORIENTATION=+ /assembly_acc=CAM_ASM_000159
MTHKQLMEVYQEIVEMEANLRRRREQQHEELQRHVDEPFEHLLALPRHLEQQPPQQQPQEMVADEDPPPAIHGNRFNSNRNTEENIQMNLRGADEEVSDSGMRKFACFVTARKLVSYHLSVVVSVPHVFHVHGSGTKIN